MSAPRCCYGCLTGDVSVRLTGQCGFEHWFCAGCWADEQELHGRIMDVLRTGADALKVRLEAPAAT